ncbi:hypothetical protein N0V82_008578 [Gnomoniopsis sp. IMI 355080]|nr:hypothetical protein N0V82_008578 [Gnomoniopsis sp. IMI 355080]
MVRPYRALTFFEEKIRTKYKELAATFESWHNTTGSEEQAGQSQNAEQDDQPGDEPQLDTSAVVHDESSSRYGVQTFSDDESSSIYEADTLSDDDSGSSNDGEAIDLSSSASLAHIKCLVEFLDIIQARVRYLSSRSCNKVTFADVWFLYTPGQEVVDQGLRQVWRVLSVNSSSHRILPPWKAWQDDELHNAKMQEPCVILDCVHITFDGKMLGSRRRTFRITSFEGEEETTSLPVLPLHMVKGRNSEADDPEEGFRQKLINRGKKFVDMIRSKPMHYNGPLIHPKEEVDSQVVVDFEQCFAYWSRYSDFNRPIVEQLVGKPIGELVPYRPCFASCCVGESVHDDRYAEQKRNEAYIGSLIPDPEDRTKKPSIAISPRPVPDTGFKNHELSEEDLVIMSYTVCGFVLRTRTWGDFDEAFSSRIHISLYYPPLTRSSTEKIFDLNLRLIQQRIEERGDKINIEHQAILSWAVEYWKTHKKMRWNGRQIRNACQTALALAEYDAQNSPQGTAIDTTEQGKSDLEKLSRPVQLTISHLETVAKAYMQFMQYLHEIYGKDAERRAKAMGIRAREFSTKSWMKALAETPEIQPPEEEDEDEEFDEDLTGMKAALKNEAVEQQTSDPAGNNVLHPSPIISPPPVVETGASGHPQAMPTAMGHLPIPPYLMPNMQGMQPGGMPFPNPFGVASPFGQAQQPHTASYQQAMEQQRQHLANLAAYGMMPGAQSSHIPGIGVQAQQWGSSQSQGGVQPPVAAHVYPGSNLPGSG